MREKRESPSLVAMRASGALLARIGILRARSPPPLPRILSSQAGALDPRPDLGNRGRATAGTSGARVAIYLSIYLSSVFWARGKKKSAVFRLTANQLG